MEIKLSSKSLNAINNKFFNSIKYWSKYWNFDATQYKKNLKYYKYLSFTFLRNARFYLATLEFLLSMFLVTR